MRLVWLLGSLLIGITLIGAQESETLRQQPYRVVEVEGQAAIGDGGEVAARDASRADAVRKAIEQVVGVYVSSETLARNFELIEDNIYTRANGFALIDKILQEGAQGGIYRTRARVKVFLVQNEEGRQALVERLRDLGLLRQLRLWLSSLRSTKAEETLISSKTTPQRRRLLALWYAQASKLSTGRP